MSRENQEASNSKSSGLAGVFRLIKRSNFSSSQHQQQQAQLQSQSQAQTPTTPVSPIVNQSASNGFIDGPPRTQSAADGSFPGGGQQYAQLFQQLKPGNPVATRVAAAAEFHQIIQEYAISNVSAVWTAAEDLTSIQNSIEARHTAFRLLAVCITQSDPSSLDRLIYFRALSDHHSANDFELQLAALIALTNNGKDLVSFERKMQPLLCKWLKNWFRESTAARQARKRQNLPSTTMSPAEVNLGHLFGFLINVVKFNFKTFEEREIVPLLQEVLLICKKTTSKDDITRSLMFIDALITYGYVPRATLTATIEVLCGAYATIKDLTDATWNAVSNLCKSYMAHNSIMTLRSILEAPLQPVEGAPQPNTNTLRGAVCFLERLLVAPEDEGLPPLQFSTVMLSYQDAMRLNSARLELDICRSIYNIFNSKRVMSRVAYDEWTVPMDILLGCSKRVSDDTMSRNDKETIAVAIKVSLLQIIALLEAQCTSAEFGPTDVVVEFLMQLHLLIPDSCGELVIAYYATEHMCYPSCSEWLENSHNLVDIFFKARQRPFQMRISILSLIKDVYETIKEVCDEESLHELVAFIFEDMQVETDVKVLEAMVKIAVDIVRDGNQGLYTHILDCMTGTLAAHRAQNEQLSNLDMKPGLSTSSGISLASSIANVIARGLVYIFMQNMNKSAKIAAPAYEELVKVAASNGSEMDARLTAMRLLFRIRADSDFAVCLVDDTESSSLAMVLGKTSRVLDDRNGSGRGELGEGSQTWGRGTRNPTNPNLNQGTIGRSASRANAEKFEQMKPKFSLWSYPEQRPLPEAVSIESSQVLYTHLDVPIPGLPPLPTEKGMLNMTYWLDTVVSILEDGADWEIYSYVLVHFPAQLSNKAVLRACKEKISKIRAVICDQLHANKFPNVDLPVEVKKADLAVVLIQALTTLICFHEFFNKLDQEAIVKAFQLGLHSWQRAAKPCIHSLSICCYELPLATSKFLPGILLKLAQIITSFAVSVHILEFLSLLARLPNLYVNFTEADFRSIFAIAFRYIQHTKALPIEQALAQSRHGSVSSPSGQPANGQEQADTPQYVLTLAYNVLATWFLSLKLNDRPKYVSWIARGLIMGDGAKDTLDEQSQACIDMLRRFTYADQDIKSYPMRPNALPGQSISKSWLLGLKIITIQTSTTSGVSQVTVRQPSGTATFFLKPESQQAQWLMQGSFAQDLLAPPLEDEDTLGLSTMTEPAPRQQASVMPSHVLMQLTADMSTSELSRPVLLPDDDITQRALNVFDRIPVVDFHKIGVIYVGTGQTTENEILSNVMGSSDYTDFVDRLGDLIILKGTTINTGGLDRDGTNIDGEFAFFWTDKITQIIFHVTTMMPTNRVHDPQCTNKKRHIGNDFVNIIFNNSGLPFNFNTLPSQFNFVNIIVSPEARTGFVATRMKPYEDMDALFYRVQLICKPGIPEISPAAEVKMVSGRSLSAFVRNLALNASVFAHVYNNTGEYVSNWRHRLRAINQLRERHGSHHGSQASGSMSGGIKDHKRISGATAMSDRSGGEYESEGGGMDGLLESYDFSKWGGS